LTLSTFVVIDYSSYRKGTLVHPWGKEVADDPAAHRNWKANP
jgi:hypothetical protein